MTPAERARHFLRGCGIYDDAVWRALTHEFLLVAEEAIEGERARSLEELRTTVRSMGMDPDRIVANARATIDVPRLSRGAAEQRGREGGAMTERWTPAEWVAVYLLVLTGLTPRAMSAVLRAVADQLSDCK